MPTPAKGYFLKDGTRVPGTTTVIGRFKDSGALMFWAFKQGQSGKSRLYEDTEKAADIGTCAHAMVELHTKGGSEAECQALVFIMLDGQPKMQAAAQSAFAAYLSWSKNFQVDIVEREIQLVSEKERYGGTPDAIGYVHGALVLLDWKTSNAVYSDHLIQLAAYKNLWEENFPDRPLTGCHLLRFAKENGDFAHHYYQDLSREWRQFLLFREAYHNDLIIKKRAA